MSDLRSPRHDDTQEVRVPRRTISDFFGKAAWALVAAFVVATGTWYSYQAKVNTIEEKTAEVRQEVRELQKADRERDKSSAETAAQISAATQRMADLIERIERLERRLDRREGQH